MRKAVKITTADVDRCFEGQSHQADVMVALYKLVYPNWDEIASVDGYPSMSKDISKHSWARFIAFDKEHHPKVMAAGLWMNSGFSTDQSLPPRTVMPCPVTMKGEQTEDETEGC